MRKNCVMKATIFGIIFLMVGSSIVPIMCKSIEQNYISSNFRSDEIDQNQSQYNGAYGGWSFAQSFKPTMPILTKIKIMYGYQYEYKNTYLLDPPIGYTNVSIHDNLFKDPLAVVSIPGDNIPLLYGNWIECDFPDLHLTPEQTYYICIEPYITSPPGIYVGWCEFQPDPYPRGEEYHNYNGNWTNWSLSDFTFQTYGRFNAPPNQPTIDGPTSVKAKIAYQWNFSSADPDNDDIFYKIDWSDGTPVTEWYGPYHSGEIMPQSHSYDKRGTYTIKAKVKDTSGAESDWGMLPITVPYSYNILFLHFWEKLFELFPHTFEILRHLMEY